VKSTFLANDQTAEHKWVVIDATNQVVGRLAVVISSILRGKHKPTYTPHTDTGDFVIIINADKVKFTGDKWNQKTYQYYSHYAGGQKVIPALEMLKRKPQEIIYLAVRRMMTRGPMAYKQIKKMKIFTGPTHDHQAQQPTEYKMPA